MNKNEKKISLGFSGNGGYACTRSTMDIIWSMVMVASFNGDRCQLRQTIVFWSRLLDASARSTNVVRYTSVARNHKILGSAVKRFSGCTTFAWWFRWLWSTWMWSIGRYDHELACASCSFINDSLGCIVHMDHRRTDEDAKCEMRKCKKLRDHFIWKFSITF